ncbi:hypothetical protein SO802_000846 [Lithocarpus litseifolius]|uniref:Uncharacterized protein n=1 Tax=Lithocarpus litseifolius TaxID=425828 RepID=A0AAW2DSN8_9ROSI
MHSRSDKVFRSGGTRGFKFEEGWLLWADCEQTVEEAWKVRGRSGSAMAVIQEKIHECSAGFSAWGSSKTHPNIEEIKNLQKQIERLNYEELIVEKKAEFLEVSKNWMTSSLNRRFIGTKGRGSHGFNMVTKTPKFFILKPPKEDEEILFKGYEINNRFGWRRLMTLPK